MKKLYALTALVFLLSCEDDPGNGETITDTSTKVQEPASISYTVVNVYPHDTSSYTQGLQWHEGHLYEGTGMKGESRLLKVKLADGKPVQQVKLDANLFGEGITILNNKIYQLTWQEHKVLVYDLVTLKKVQEFPWAFEGWGITNNGKDLIISTGTNNLYFVDPSDFKIINTVSVSSNYGPEGSLNELEFVDGKIYANVWNRDDILVIEPKTGAVNAKINMANLLDNSKRSENTDVLNGIAYDPAKKSFYITGKRWPSLFEVKLNQ